MKRIGRPVEIAWANLYLTSEEASYRTGSEPVAQWRRLPYDFALGASGMELFALLPLALLAWAVARSVRTRRAQKQQAERFQRLERRIESLDMTSPR
jgi:hypothetical protein